MDRLDNWLESISTNEWNIYIKRLSANDTGLTGGNQVGVYFPKAILAAIFPSINTIREPNPEYKFSASVISHNLPQQELRAVYYNSKFHGKTRNEKRITRWNTGVANNPIQNVENTGAIAIFAFKQPSKEENATELQVWVCESIDEESTVEALIGEVVPGTSVYEWGEYLFGGLVLGNSFSASNVELPNSWLHSFPSGAELIAHSNSLFKFEIKDPDKLLLKKRECEFSLFKQVEELHVLGIIRDGFETVDAFIKTANSISNRRKSRAGRSLELHLEHLFNQFGVNQYASQCITEGNKKPDFIFPSSNAYHDPDFPVENLKMLAVKTTCKDRWRQALNEANRIKTIYLFTLQEGLSENQFNEMLEENIILVVPKPLHKCYPESFRKQILSLTQFIELVKS